MALSKMFSLAEAWGLAPSGGKPRRFVVRYREGMRERLLSGDETAGSARRSANRGEEPDPRARQRWTAHFGAAVAPDSNLNSASSNRLCSRG